MATLSIGRAWDETRAFIARDKRLLVPLTLGLIVLPGAVLGLIAPGAQLGEQQRDATAIGLTLVAAVIGLIAQLTIIRLALGFDGSLGEAIVTAAKRLWVLLAAMLLLVFPAVFLIGIVAGLGGAGGAAGSAAPKGPAAIAILVLAAVFIWLAIRLLPISVAAVAEQRGPIDLLKRCFALTRGYFWRLFAFLLIVAVGFLVLLAAVSLVGGSLITAILGQPEPMTLSALAIGLLGALLQALVATVYAVMLTRIYAQLTAAPAA